MSGAGPAQAGGEKKEGTPKRPLQILWHADKTCAVLCLRIRGLHEGARAGSVTRQMEKQTKSELIFNDPVTIRR